MTQHTPGPWTVVLGARLEVHAPMDEIGWAKSVVWNAGLCTDKESQANARLIAAAPDMLAVLQDIADFWEEPTLSLWVLKSRVSAVIAKAKGGAA